MEIEVVFISGCFYRHFVKEHALLEGRFNYDQSAI